MINSIPLWVEFLGMGDEGDEADEEDKLPMTNDK
jgi:hypothetical protein